MGKEKRGREREYECGLLGKTKLGRTETVNLYQTTGREPGE